MANGSTSAEGDKEGGGGSLKPDMPTTSGFSRQTPLDGANAFTKYTYLWVTPLVRWGRRHTLGLEDVFALPAANDPEKALAQFDAHWKAEVAKKGPEKASFVRCLLRTYRWPFARAIVFVTLSTCFAAVGPVYFLRELIAYSGSSSSDLGYGIGMAVGLLVCDLARSALVHAWWFSIAQVSLNYRSIVYALVYTKAMRLRDLSGYSIGELVNICSNDGQRVLDAGMYFPFVYVAALTVSIVLVASALIFGPAAILGALIFLLMFPIQALVARRTGNLRRQAIACTDRRVQLMNEILSCVKLIKMYAWERPFAAQIEGIRAKERVFLTRAGYLQSFSLSLAPSLSVFATVAAVMVHVYSGRLLEPDNLFTVVALFNVLRFSFAVLPMGVKAGSEAKVGVKRLKMFLSLDDYHEPTFTPASPEVAIRVTGDFFWPNTVSHGPLQGPAGNDQPPAGTASDEEASPARRDSAPTQEMTLHGVAFSVTKGSLVGVCGAVGAGKTSLLSAILTQMRSREGRVEIGGRMGYASQQPWIQSDTLRQNILFGSEFEQQKYDHAVEVCGLGPDLAVLPAGDQTEIGERGINLSGGQKQRVSLARAVYANADIFLLDDPLSAVDAHVGRHIFEKCIAGSMADKSVVFVTHQLQYLSQCDQVVFINHGRLEQGRYSQLLQESAAFRDLISHHHSDGTSAVDGDGPSAGGPAQAAVAAEHEGDAAREPLDRDGAPASVASRPGGIDHERDPTPLSEPVSRSGADEYITVGDEETTPGADEPCTAASPATPAKYADEGKPRRSEEGDALEATGATPENGDAGASKDAAEDAAADAETAAEQARQTTAGKQLVVAETSVTGSVTLSSYASYMRAGGGLALGFFVLLLFFVAMGVKAFSDWYLSYWMRQGDGTPADPAEAASRGGNVQDNPEFDTFALRYGMTAVALLLFQLVRGTLFTQLSLRAASNLHNRVFKAVLRAPMSFFDTTPSGRVLNRFSKDLDEVDVRLPNVTEQFLQNATLVVITLGVIAAIFPWFLIALVPISAFFFYTVRYFRPTQRQVKRIDNVSRSPLFSHISSSLGGIATIRAFGKADEFTEKMFSRLADNSRAYFCFLYSSRWFAFRLDFSTSMIIGSTAFLIVGLHGSIDPTLAGLSIVYATSMAGIMQFTTRLSAEVEARFTSAERIQQYILHTPQEKADEVQGAKPAANWPQNGCIIFDNVSVRYRHGLPLVLRGLSFSIKAQEKIGIAGRTGSGKSTIALCLFRILELAEGTITIDGIDTSTLGLHDLRSKLAIIPQDPVLFFGSVRYNVDPFNEYTDSAIWTALEDAHIRSKVSSMAEGLQAHVGENGSNFSVGERQLLCMARALLRHSKVLVLDEATASIDTKTDNLIQDTIAHCFRDCTVLTVAHRLNTLLDSDKILILDHGELVEFDTPSNLMDRDESALSAMLESTGLTSEQRRHSSVKHAARAIVRQTERASRLAASALAEESAGGDVSTRGTLDRDAVGGITVAGAARLYPRSSSGRRAMSIV